MRIDYTEVATLTVKEHGFWNADIVTIQVKRDSISVTGPSLPADMKVDRARSVARLFASAATRAVFLHRRMFGRGPR